MSDTQQEILEELKKTNILLLSLIDTLEQGAMNRAGRGGTPVGGGRGSSSNLSQEDRDNLDIEVDLDWWYLAYGDEYLPAKYMSATVGIPAPGTNPYTKDEGDYIFNRLQDYIGETNEQGTHRFTYLGKVWCKREKNARNCFAFIPVKGAGYNE